MRVDTDTQSPRKARHSLLRMLLIFCLCLVVSSACTQREMQEVVVIGGGLMGSASAWHLTEAGVPVLLLEQQDSVYTSGSSFGQTRLVQKHSIEDDRWPALHMRTLKETARLMAYLNERYNVARPYVMEDVYTTAVVTNLYRADQLGSIVSVVERQGVDHKIAADAREANEQFKMSIPEDVAVLREYGLYSGTLNPIALINHLHLGISGKGSEIRYNSRVTEISRVSGGFRIDVMSADTEETYQVYAKNVVSAVGPYTSRLLGSFNSKLGDALTPERVFSAFVKLKSETFATMNVGEQVRYAMAYPVVDMMAEDDASHSFSTIEEFDQEGNPLLKVVGHHRRSAIQNLDMVWDLNLSDEERAFALRETIDYLRILGLSVTEDDLEVVGGRSSVYTLTEDEVPYITHLTDDDGQQIEGLIMLAGMSGTGARSAMAYGRIAADMVLGTDEDPDFTEIIPWLRFGR